MSKMKKYEAGAYRLLKLILLSICTASAGAIASALVNAVSSFPILSQQMETLSTQMEKIQGYDSRIVANTTRIEGLDKRLDKHDELFEKQDARIYRLELRTTN